MRTVLKDSLSLKVPVSEYASIEEADQVAGRVGAMLDCGNNSLAMYGPLVEFRDDIATLLEGVTQITRKVRDRATKTLKDGTTKEVVTYETEKTYFDGIEAAVTAGQVKLYRVGPSTWRVSTPDGDRSSSYKVNEKGEITVTALPAPLDGGELVGLQAVVLDLQAARAAGKASPDGAWVCDIKEPVRTPKVRKLPDEVKAAAQRIFDNGNSVKWQEKLLAEGIAVNFTGDTASDVLVLGWAIKEREDRKRRAEEEKRRAALAELA